MMKNKTGLLLRAMLTSTSGWNVLRYSKDKKRKNQVIGSYVGFAVIFLMLLFLAGANAVGYGMIGLAEAIPELCALALSAVAFLFTLLKSNGYLFGFKEYDMLIAMPFEVKTVVACKFLYMYIKNLIWYIPVSISMLVGYMIYTDASVLKAILWIVLSLIIPIIPTIIASAIGVLIVRIGVSFKYKKAIQMILTFAFILVCMCSRFIIEAIFKNGEETKVMEDMSAVTENISGYYFPSRWFGLAINQSNLIYVFGLILVTVALYVIFFAIVSRSYRMINSKLMTGTSRKDFAMTAQKKSSVVRSIAKKEWKRLTGSTIYATNACFGEIFAILLGVVALFVKAESLIAVIMQGAPIKPEILIPALPVFVYFFVGMVPTTCCSLSLEGKNYWIIQSMPIKKMDLYKGKMLFNMWLMVPCMLIGSIGLGVSFRVDLIEYVLYILFSFAVCAFSTCLGMITGIKHAKFDWENEVEVVKQGAAVAVYLFPNMIISMGLMVGAVALGMVLNTKIVLVIMALCYSAFAGLFYFIVTRLATERSKIK